ncbi:hypothetical protein DFH08DRAFT_318283 [Mycena albidolilacea]|uniref:RING-type domain-containing protein n=1 Tax=Mycena albidolilacea TaxID=1033008 RepID=A0AAD6ZMS0_9AGAR|nr:hypothetical protein DFH08DRAFT_318283 [Mycena albidolilacea]
MPNCSICLESFTSPVSLPCGHVFCRECIRRTVDSTKSWDTQHFCPTCRGPYSILNIDPGLIPPYLRPHILPPIRRVFLDDTTASASTAATSTSASASTAATPPAAGPSADLARAEAELNVLRMHCATWRKRAEVHAAANTTLLGFVRTARDCALRLRAERDAERNSCVLLKRKLAELIPDLDLNAESPFTKRSRHEEHAQIIVRQPPRPCLPVFLLQCKQAGIQPSEAGPSLLGPPMKRRRAESGDDTAPIPVSDVPGAAPAPTASPAAPSSDPAPRLRAQ